MNDFCYSSPQKKTNLVWEDSFFFLSSNPEKASCFLGGMPTWLYKSILLKELPNKENTSSTAPQSRIHSTFYEHCIFENHKAVQKGESKRNSSKTEKKSRVFLKKTKSINNRSRILITIKKRYAFLPPPPKNHWVEYMPHERYIIAIKLPSKSRRLKDTRPAIPNAM